MFSVNPNKLDLKMGPSSIIIPKRSVNNALRKIRDLHQHYLFHLLNTEKPVEITKLFQQETVWRRFQQMIFVCKLNSKPQLQLADEHLMQMKPQYQLLLYMAAEKPQTTPYSTVTILITSIDCDENNSIEMKFMCLDTGRGKMSKKNVCKKFNRTTIRYQRQLAYDVTWGRSLRLNLTQENIQSVFIGLHLLWENLKHHHFCWFEVKFYSNWNWI